MKTNFKFLAALAILAVGFTACNKDDDNGPGDEPKGDQASVKVAFITPSTYATEVGEDEENKIITATLFLYNSTGTSLQYHDTKTVTNDTVTFSHEDITSGVKNIYVGINLDATAVNAIVTNGVYATLTNQTPSSWYTDDNFSMFSQTVKQENLKPIEEGVNDVTVKVDRWAVKVRAAEAGSLDKDNISGADFGTLDMVMGNINKKIFPFQKIEGGNIVDPNWESVANGTEVSSKADFLNEFTVDSDGLNTGTTFDDNKVTIGTTFSGATPKYAIENTSRTKLRGELTYASIRAEFCPLEIATYTGGNLTQTNNSDQVPTKKDYYVLQTSTGDFYYFAGDATGKAQAELALSEIFGSNGEVKIYKDGYCYYHVLLNGTIDGSNTNHNVERNQAYRLSIDAINSLGHNGPEITRPIDPVDTEAAIKVTVEVNPWVIVTQGVGLEQ